MTPVAPVTLVSFDLPGSAGDLRSALDRCGRPCRLIPAERWLRSSAEPETAPLLLHFGARLPAAPELERVRSRAAGRAWGAVIDGPAPGRPPAALASAPPRWFLWPDDRETLVAWLDRPGAADDPGAAALGELGVVGRSAVFLDAVSALRRYARCDAPVLLTGETGVGKELAARALHRLSARAAGPFVPVNCGAIPDTLLESELFGHVRGAFTDARAARAGLVAEAEGGTLMLDELDSLSPRAQVALLRFLQDRRYRPVGAAAEKTADLRVVAASNADLGAEVEAGRFRRDLWFRLSVLSLRIPALRERPEDVAPLAEHFAARLAARYGRRTPPLSPRLLAALAAHDWPGNVRELENFMHRAVVLSETGEIGLDEAGAPGVAGHGVRPAGASAAPARPCAIRPYHEAKAEALTAFETGYLRRLMAMTDGNVTRAAEVAGTERRSLGRMLKRNGLDGAGEAG